MKPLKSIFIFVSFLFFFVQNYAQEAKKETPISPETRTANQKCFKCHGNKIYTLKNPEDSTQTVKRRNFYYIDTTEFYLSNHKSMGCSDCHSSDFEKFPHELKLRFESMTACTDCHSDDNGIAFSKIQKDFEQSTHHLKMKDNFNCRDCHNSHSYKINARSRKTIAAVVAYDNQICLNCHADYDRFKMLSDRDSINIIKHHAWLPNQALHFKTVRCIECHAQMNDSLMVAHKILPKSQAVHRCVACHSKDSRLLQSLYNYKTEQGRTNGFSNGKILKELYIIGANRNYYLNLISVIMALSVGIGIAIHIIFRIITKKRYKYE